MNKSTVTRWLVVGLLASCILSRVGVGDQADVFGRFVGTWDVEYTDFSKDGRVLH
jgi:hypothetical protein